MSLLHRAVFITSLLVGLVFTGNVQAEVKLLGANQNNAAPPNVDQSDMIDRTAQLPSVENPRASASPLASPLASATDADKTTQRSTSSSSLTSSPVTTIVGALGITLGLFCCFVAIMRRSEKRGLMKQLPKDAVEVVGHTQLGPRQKLVVVRCGAQAIVLGISPAGIQNLVQMDDPDEAARFVAQCRGDGSTASFRTALRELDQQPHSPGFVEATDTPRQNSSRGKRLFLRA